MVDIGMPDPRFGSAGAGLPPFRDGTVKDAAAFRARMEAFKLEVQRRQHQTLKRCLAEALTGLVMATPVGNPTLWKVRRGRKGYVGGHARRNWQITGVQGTAPVAQGVDPSGQQTTTEGYAKIASLPVTTRRMWIENRVPYMERLNEGWSKQAPAGFIGAVFQQVLAKYARVK